MHPRGSWLPVLLWLGASAFCLDAAEPAAVRVESTPQQARLTLEWAAPFTFESSTQGRELLLRFSTPIEIPQIEELVRQAPEWLSNLATGFDTLLIEAARDVAWQVRGEGKSLVIVLRPVTTPVTEDPAATLRLRLIRAHALADSGRPAQGLALMRSLAAEFPDNPRVLADLALMESAANRQLRAARFYDRARELDPDNEDITDSADEFDRTRAPRVQTDFEHRQVAGAQSEEITSLSARSQITSALEANMRLETDVFSAPVGVAGVRTSGEVHLGYELESGASLGGSVYESGGRAGAGIAFARPDDTGQTGLRLTWHQPYWLFLETLTGGGVRDRVELRREQNLLPHLSGRVLAGANRYDMNGIAAARSYFIEGALTYRILPKPNLVAEYGLDIEHRYSLGSEVAAGQRITPLPLASREVHAATLNLSQLLRRHWQAEMYGGGAVDRLGGRAPFFGGRMTYNSRSPLGAQAFFDRRLYIVNTTRAETRAGGYLFWRF